MFGLCLGFLKVSFLFLQVLPEALRDGYGNLQASFLRTIAGNRVLALVKCWTEPKGKAVKLTFENRGGTVSLMFFNHVHITHKTLFELSQRSLLKWFLLSVSCRPRLKTRRFKTGVSSLCAFDSALAHAHECLPE